MEAEVYCSREANVALGCIIICGMEKSIPGMGGGPMKPGKVGMEVMERVGEYCAALLRLIAEEDFMSLRLLPL